jgi:CO dehydrogenase nickel-insertion accessory protein CooC1
MKKLHFIMQGKGGVGKTLVSSVLAQYYLQNGCISAIDIK